VFVQDPIVYTT